MMKKIILILIVLITAGKLQAQTELTLPWLQSVYQSTFVNISSNPNHKVSIGLPGISGVRAGITNTGFNFKDLVKQRTDTALHLSVNQGIENLRNKNYLYAGSSVELFHLRIKVKDIFYSFHMNENVNLRFGYPKDFVKLPWKGNGEYLGETLNLSGLAVDATHYREYALGFQKINDKNPFSFGGRIKLLQGLANVSWKNKELSLKTDADMYRLDVGSEGTLNTSLPFYVSEDTSYTTTNLREYFTNFSNKGFAIDLGAEYKYDSRITFSAALSNVGFIKWKSNPYNYKIKGGTYFEGFDPVTELYKDSATAEEYLDSLASKFEYKKTQNKYSTWLPPRLFLSAKYQLFTKTQIGASIFLEKFQTIRPGFTLAFNQKAGRLFEGVLTYSIQYRSWSNIGLALMFKPGPVQFYFAGDNMFRTWTTHQINDASFTVPEKARFLNFRFGINLVFGRIKTADKQPLPEEAR